MYKIINEDGNQLAVVENPVYIKVGRSGCYTNATPEEADGIALKSIPYALVGHELTGAAGTVLLSEFDGGSLIGEQGALLDYVTMMAGIDLSAMTPESGGESNYDTVADNYLGGYWNDDMVGEAVEQGWITAEEYEEITGKDWMIKGQPVPEEPDNGDDGGDEGGDGDDGDEDSNVPAPGPVIGGDDETDDGEGEPEGDGGTVDEEDSNTDTGGGDSFSGGDRVGNTDTGDK